MTLRRTSLTDTRVHVGEDVGKLLRARGRRSTGRGNGGQTERDQPDFLAQIVIRVPFRAGT